jgi:hypothetical protein
MGLVEHYDRSFERIVDSFRSIKDQAERMMMLIEFASCYVDPPPSIAKRPYPAECKLSTACKDIFFWAIPRPDQRLDFYFAIECREGVSAKAFAVMLSRTLSGVELEKIAAVSSEVIDVIFGSAMPPDNRAVLETMLEAVRSAARDMLDEEDV